MDGAGICHASHWAVFQGRVHRQKWAWCLEGPSVLLGTVIRRQISRRARLAQCYLGAGIWPLYQIVLSVFQLGPCTQVHRRTFKVHPGYITLWKLASRSSTSVCPPYDYTTCLSECSWGQLWAISPFPAPFLIALLPPYKKKNITTPSVLQWCIISGCMREYVVLYFIWEVHVQKCLKTSDQIKLPWAV